MLQTVRVPPPFTALFEQAENYVRSFFEQERRDPAKGTIHVGNERYVLVRGESLYIAFFDHLKDAIGAEASLEFIYNVARAMGRADARRFSEERNITEPTAKLSTGPVLFSHCGWAFVDIFDDSRPAPDGSYFLHYEHPNTFESEVLTRRGLLTEGCQCVYSAGYSAGWCSESYSVEVHAREIRCTARGDARCEFIMAPFDRLDELERALKG